MPQEPADALLHALLSALDSQGFTFRAFIEDWKGKHEKDVKELRDLFRKVQQMAADKDFCLGLEAAWQEIPDQRPLAAFEALFGSHQMEESMNTIIFHATASKWKEKRWHGEDECE